MRRRITAVFAAIALVATSLLALSSSAKADTTTATISGTISLPAGFTIDPNDTYVRVEATDISYEDSTGTIDWTNPTAGTYSYDVPAGKSYTVCVSSTISNTLVDTCYGDVASYSPSIPTVDVPATGGNFTANINMIAGVTISGTVYLPDGKTPADGANVGVFDTSSGGLLQVTEIGTDSNGQYSALVAPGDTYTVGADMYGYLQSWLGGISVSALDNNGPSASDVKSVSAPSAGQDITLAQAGTISGTVTAGGQPLGSVVSDASLYVCLVTDPTQTYTPGNCAYVGDFYTGSMYGSLDLTTGKYTISGLDPNAQYAVYAVADGYLQTWYGQATGDYASSGWSSATPTIAGASGVDIDLVQGITVTGTITGIPSTIEQADVYVCQVITSGGLDIGGDCQRASAYSNPDSAGAGQYAVTVDPSWSKVVIYAQALGTLNTYRSTSSPSYANMWAVDYLPVAGVSEIALPGVGQTLGGQDIALQLPSSISGTVHLPSGYSFGTSTAYDGSTVANATVEVCQVVTNSDGSLGTNYCDNLVTIDPSTGQYTATGLVPGQKYVARVIQDWPGDPNPYFTPTNDLAATYATSYAPAGGSVTSADLSSPPSNLNIVTAPAGGTTKTGVDITMLQAATISGTVYLPDGKTPAGSTDNEVCVEAVVPDPASPGGLDYAAFTCSADGTYSFDVAPGQTYYLFASLNGYPITYLGGQVGFTSTLPGSSTTGVKPTTGGQSITNQNIVLSQGASISGQVTLAAGDSPTDVNAGVWACTVDQSDCESGTVSDNGTYTIPGLVPNTTYFVYAVADGYATKYFGGYTGNNPVSDAGVLAAGVTAVPLGAVGSNTPNIDINLVKAVTITGTVSPTSVASQGMTDVYACPVTTTGGQASYDTQNCYGTWVYSTDGSYTINSLQPGQSYVVIATASGQTDAWYGGYSGDSQLWGTADQLPVPASGVTQVSGVSGQVVQSVNMSFGATAAVTFNANGGTPASTVVSTGVGGTVTLPTVTRTHYTLTGWNTAANGTGTAFTASTAVNDNITVYAQWKQAQQYTLTYDANGGTGTAPAVASYYSDDTPAAAASPFTNAPNTFVNWNTAADGSGTAYAVNDPVSIAGGNVTLYAQWAPPATYKVSYYANGGTGSMSDATAYLSGDTATVLDSTFTAPAHTTFGGWNTKADGTGTAYAASDTISMSANVALYAQWTADPTYTVTYNANGGTGSVTDANVYYSGDTATVKAATGLTPPTHKVFDSWNTAADGSGTRYAVGDPLAISAAAATRDAVGATPITLYAQWVDAPQYTVTYDANFPAGGGTGSIDNLTAYAGDSVTLSDGSSLTPTGYYTFAGWNTDPGGTVAGGIAVSSPTVLGHDMTLYAQWAPITYGVSYNLNGGTSATPVADHTSYAPTTTATVLATVPTLAHGTFLGWQDASGNLYKAGDQITMNGNVALTAQWKMDPTYTITYDANGGTGTTVDPRGYYAGDPAPAAANGFTNPGYTFAGWNTKADGSGTACPAGATLMISGNVTLYAQWVLAPVPPNGGSGTNAATGGSVASPQTAAQIIMAMLMVGAGVALLTRRRMFAPQKAYVAHRMSSIQQSYVPRRTFPAQRADR